MVYTVGEMARLLNVPASTLRYYDKEGLLPFVERSSGGIRMFKDSDYEWLQVIGCLKKAGMSIRDIRRIFCWRCRAIRRLATGFKCSMLSGSACWNRWSSFGRRSTRLITSAGSMSRPKRAARRRSCPASCPEEYPVRGQPSSRCAAFQRDQLIAEIKMRGAHRNPLQMLHE